MRESHAGASRLAELLNGVLSPPRAGHAAYGDRHTVVVSAGLHRAVTGNRPPVDSLGCAEILHGAASDPDPALAALKARMEAVERYASVTCAEQLSTVASAVELGPGALPTRVLPRHDPGEPGPRSGTHGVLGDRDQVRWVRATRCGDGAVVYVPTVMAFNTAPRHPGEEFWVPVSTGTAAHLSWAQALENAVLEVVERDAVALTWLLRTSAERLPDGFGDYPGAEPEARLPYSAEHMREYTLARWDITSDLGIPTVLSVLRGPGRRVHQIVGAAARRTLWAASAASAAEAAQIHASLEASVRAGDRAPRSPVRCRRVHDGALFMAPESKAHHFDFLGGSEPHDAKEPSRSPTPGSDPVRRLIEAGHEIYAVDLTPRDVAPSGVRVVRAIIPSLQPLSPVFAARYLASDRLRRIGVPLAEVNPMPCPLA
ncbi:YcaO-like family protein [Streptomyces viridochromogenes]|uniref:YcaO-like family protein n=1 Tax=Streptomyces viridochromogenes TaxID=1938 RepID=UPI000A8B966A|nr:YcaO-like family protein [Streptomyces viridochromogenes]